MEFCLQSKKRCQYKSKHTRKHRLVSVIFYLQVNLSLQPRHTYTKKNMFYGINTESKPSVNINKKNKKNKKNLLGRGISLRQSESCTQIAVSPPWPPLQGAPKQQHEPSNTNSRILEIRNGNRYLSSTAQRCQ